MKHKQNHPDADGQKRLMATSMGLPADTYIRKVIDTAAPGDYGADPIGDDKYRMVPSGDVVDFAERCRRLAHKAPPATS
jgi:hypothetical protein